MTPELVREIVEDVCESFFSPGAARRWIADQHPRDKDGKFAGGGGEAEAHVAKAEKYLRVAEKHGKRAVSKRAKANRLKAKAEDLHAKNEVAIAAYKKKYGKDPLTGKKIK